MSSALPLAQGVFKLGEWEVEGWKLEQRCRFGDQKERTLLPAAYLEIEREHDEYELELS